MVRIRLIVLALGPILATGCNGVCTLELGICGLAVNVKGLSANDSAVVNVQAPREAEPHVFTCSGASCSHFFEHYVPGSFTVQIIRNGSPVNANVTVTEQKVGDTSCGGCTGKKADVEL